MIYLFMKLIVFAGGAGKRFWPIGRESKPKQFIRIFNGKSTFELTIDRLAPVYGLYNIFVSTTESYVPKIKELVPDLPTSNIFTEPARRDVGPAVGLALMRLKKLGVKEPIAIIWADHYIKNVKNFQNTLKKAEVLILQKKYKVILVGAKPQYPATNLGWIKISNPVKSFNKLKPYHLEDFVYRPEQELATKLYTEKTGLWNTAYMISTIDTLLHFYSRHYPELYKQLQEIYQYLETPKEAQVLQNIYPSIPKIHFDHIVSYNLDKKSTAVLATDMGWTDPGTLYSYKQTFKPNQDNFIQGQVVAKQISDSLLINQEPNKLLVTAYMDNIIVINTKDAILVIPATKVKEISTIYEKLMKNPKYNKYIK